MCFIAVCKGEKLTKQEIVMANTQNPDGIGIAWKGNGNVNFKKGFKLMDFIEFYDELPENTTHVVHFRLGTIGRKVAELTHPFKCAIEQNNDLDGVFNDGLLFHNGHSNNWKETLMRFIISNGIEMPDVEFSDSRAIAMIVGQHGHAILQLFDGRYVVFYPDVLKTYGDWEINGKRMFSSTLKKWGGKVRHWDQTRGWIDNSDDGYSDSSIFVHSKKGLGGCFAD